MTTSTPTVLSVDFTIEQAQAVVDEIALLWHHANYNGKKKVHLLNVLSNTLIRELTAIRAEAARDRNEGTGAHHG